MNETENMEKSNKYIYKNQLERVLLNSNNPKRLMEIIKQSNIILK